jgi:hypothetical protein
MKYTRYKILGASALILCLSKSYAQDKHKWLKVLIEPDLLVTMPDTPKAISMNGIKIYECIYPNKIFRITTEKSPLNYKGRRINEVDKEFFDSLTYKIIHENGVKRELVSDSNTAVEGHNVRFIIYRETINQREAVVKLEILNVTGIEEAMYKFYMIDFEKKDITDNESIFFNTWDLYYKFEKGIHDTR